MSLYLFRHVRRGSVSIENKTCLAISNRTKLEPGVNIVE